MHQRQTVILSKNTAKNCAKLHMPGGSAAYSHSKKLDCGAGFAIQSLSRLKFPTAL
jgi:hypothetical protein